MMSSQLSLLRVVAAVTLVGGFLSLTAKNVVDFDTWHQMNSARDVLSGHVDSEADPYTFTDVLRPVVHHEWGVGLISSWLSSRFGSQSLLALKYVLLVSTILVAFASATRRAGSWEDWGLIAVPAIPLISIGFFTALRAQMFSFLFVSILLAALAIDEGGKRWWIVLWLAAFPLWVNLHAGCLMGIVLLLVSAAERMFARKRFGHLLWVAGAMACLMVLNPSGLAYYEFLWRAVPMRRPQIMEWEGVWRSLPALAAFLLCVFTAAIRVSEKGTRGIAGVAILLLTAVLAFRAIKMAPLFGLAWINYAPAMMSGTRLRADIEKQNRTAPWRPVLCWLTLLVIFTALAAKGQWALRVPGRFSDALASPPYPVGAVQYMTEQKFSGNVIAPFEFGAYVSWKLGRGVRVFVDSRYEEVYPDRTVDEAAQFYTAQPNWQEILRHYPVAAVFVPKASALALAMPQSGWMLAYGDPEYSVYLRPDLILPVVKRDTVPDGSLP